MSMRAIPISRKEEFRGIFKMARRGNPVAQTRVGQAFRDGEFCRQSDSNAVKWFRKAAEQGDSQGQFEYGMMYAEGRGIPRNRKQAMAWWRKAAAQGNMGALSNFGRLHLGVGGDAPDIEEIEQVLLSLQQALRSVRQAITNIEHADNWQTPS